MLNRGSKGWSCAAWEAAWQGELWGTRLRGNRETKTSWSAGTVSLIGTLVGSFYGIRYCPSVTLCAISFQVDLLLTLEEYCSCEGVFEADGGAGACYGSIFAHLLRQLYDSEVVGWVTREQTAAWGVHWYNDDACTGRCRTAVRWCTSWEVVGA